jgi:hypothetical protein
MKYARRKAHEAQNRWLNGPGGHAGALESVEATVRSVLEDVAREVERNPMRREHAKYFANLVRSLADREEAAERGAEKP